MTERGLSGLLALWLMVVGAPAWAQGEAEGLARAPAELRLERGDAFELRRRSESRVRAESWVDGVAQPVALRSRIIEAVARLAVLEAKGPRVDALRVSLSAYAPLAKEARGALGRSFELSTARGVAALDSAVVTSAEVAAITAACGRSPKAALLCLSSALPRRDWRVGEVFELPAELSKALFGQKGGATVRVNLRVVASDEAEALKLTVTLHEDSGFAGEVFWSRDLRGTALIERATGMVSSLKLQGTGQLRQKIEVGGRRIDAHQRQTLSESWSLRSLGRGPVADPGPAPSTPRIVSVRPAAAGDAYTRQVRGRATMEPGNGEKGQRKVMSFESALGVEIEATAGGGVAARARIDEMVEVSEGGQRGKIIGERGARRLLVDRGPDGRPRAQALGADAQLPRRWRSSFGFLVGPPDGHALSCFEGRAATPGATYNLSEEQAQSLGDLFPPVPGGQRYGGGRLVFRRRAREDGELGAWLDFSLELVDSTDPFELVGRAFVSFEDGWWRRLEFDLKTSIGARAGARFELKLRYTQQILRRAGVATREGASGGGPVGARDAPPGATPPVKPGADAPMKPGATSPVKPGADAPVKPGATTPVKPGADTPVKPGATTPAKPAADGHDHAEGAK